LVYTTAAVPANLEVTGPIVVKLFASSSAVDTDFTAKLVDVRPDGYARNLAEGIQRMRYRASRMRPAFLIPNQVYEVTIDLWATSHVFLPGHRVRLEISSSNFPRFDRNLNTGEDQATGSRRQTAAQTILHIAAGDTAVAEYAWDLETPSPTRPGSPHRLPKRLGSRVASGLQSSEWLSRTPRMSRISASTSLTSSRI